MERPPEKKIPRQYIQRDYKGPPERHLLSEILLRAMRDVLNHEADNIKNKRSAIKWLKLNDPIIEGENLHPFSFEWICWELDINPKVIKKIVIMMRKKGLTIIV